jgi:uncharacterized protein YukJ
MPEDGPRQHDTPVDEHDTAANEQPAADDGKPAFFVSYTQADRRWAEWIAWQLEAAGYRVVIQAWDFAGGTNFVIQMDKAAKTAARTIAVLSPAYLKSAFATPEWAAALAKDPRGEARTLLPVRVGEVMPEGLLAQVAWIDLVGCDEQTATDRLLVAAKGSRAKPSRKPFFPGEHDAVPFAAGAEAVAAIASAFTAIPTVAPKPAFPAALPPIWSVPARNPLFTGREEWVARVKSQLTTANHPAVVTQAIAGLGGIGKSQLAIEYAHQNASAYRLVWWVHAETEAARRGDLLALAHRLGLDDVDSRRAESPQAASPWADAQLAAVRTWLEQHRDWLLIFDNVESPDDIRDLLPRAGVGHVLITSRYSAWDNVADVLSLGVWAPREAISYLLTRTKQSDEASAAMLAEMLGYLPLAVEQAAAYIDESRISLSHFTELFRTSRARLLAAASSKATVATVWQLSLQSVRQKSKHAVTLLQLAAFLPPDNFPRERLRQQRQDRRVNGGAIAELLGDDLALNEAIAVLRRYSLIEATPEHISVHRLVQVVVQESLSEAERGQFAMAAHRLQFGTEETSSDEHMFAPAEDFSFLAHDELIPLADTPPRGVRRSAFEVATYAFAFIFAAFFAAAVSEGLRLWFRPEAATPKTGTDSGAVARPTPGETGPGQVAEMPLLTGIPYGVLRGKVDRWEREIPHAGSSQSPQLHIRVLDAAGKPWRIALNMRTGGPEQMRVIYQRADRLNGHPIVDGLSAFSSGFTDLTHKARSASNALDYSRAPLFDLTRGIAWPPGYDVELQNAVISDLSTLKESGGELFVFGSPWHDARPKPGIDSEFGTADGMQNIHMNQGIADEPLALENGVFQDGGLLLKFSDHVAGLFFRCRAQWLPTDVRSGRIKGISKEIPPGS